MKKLVGHALTSDRRMPPSVATRAIPTDRHRAMAGLAVRRMAAAAGVITRVSTSSTPTTWIASAVVTATSNDRATESILRGTPRASATSGSTLANSRGRPTTASAPRTTTATAASTHSCRSLTPTMLPNRRFVAWVA
jgi:hypothetical protein